MNDFPARQRTTEQSPHARTAAEILGPSDDEPVDPNDPQLHGWDPDGPGDRQREDRP